MRSEPLTSRADDENICVPPPLTIGLSVVIGATLLITFYCDGPLERAYFDLNLPSWLWNVEHLVSKWSHLGAIGIGLVLVAMRGPKWIRHAIWALLVSSLIAALLKYSIGRARPCNGADPFLFFGPSFEQDSFPSGHSVATWSIVAIIFRCYPRIGWVWFIMGLVIAWARLHAQAHFCSDLLAGAIVAWCVEHLSWVLQQKKVFIQESKSAHTSAGWLRYVLPWVGIVLLPIVAVGIPNRTSIPPRMTESETELVIRALYDRILNRPVDDAANALWAVELPKRRMIVDPLFEFAVSGEFYRSIQEIPEVEDQIQEVYRRLLDRSATKTEIQNSRSLFDGPVRAKKGTAILASRIILSVEYQTRFGAFSMPGDPRVFSVSPDPDGEEQSPNERNN